MEDAKGVDDKLQFILNSEIFSGALLEFLKSQFCEENLLFIMEVTKFIDLDVSDINLLKTESELIYDKFVKGLYRYSNLQLTY